MNVIFNLVVAVQILAALAMIGLVLIQHGKGADMGASFGSGASGSLFGATGSANFLSRSTAVCAGVFFCCTLALAYFSNDRAHSSAGSVLDTPSTSAPAASAVAPTGAALIPGAAAPVAARTSSSSSTSTSTSTSTTSSTSPTSTASAASAAAK